MAAALRRLKFVALAGFLALFLVPTTGLTQFGGPGGGPPGGGGFPGGGMGRFGGRGGPGGWGGFSSDPNERWNLMTGGKEVWRRSEITDPNQQFYFDRIAQRIGVTNGEITREQYMAYSQQRQAMRAAGGGFGPPGGFTPPSSAPAAAPAAAGAPAAPAAAPADRNANSWFDQMAEGFFRRYDRNGDGLLNNDEMPDALKAERDRWDTNKDGFISLDEFKEYAKARMQEMRAERGGQGWSGPGGWGNQNPGDSPAPQVPFEDDEDRRQPVYRAANLPKELPSWFKEADTDGDGQIGLYEWKATGRPIEEFVKMDRNNDGFLTVDEVLRYQKLAQEAGGGTTTGTLAAAAPPGMNGGGPPRMNAGGPPVGMPAGRPGGNWGGNGGWRGGPSGGPPGGGPGSFGGGRRRRPSAG